MEANARKIQMAETERRRGEGRGRKEIRKESGTKEKETEKGKNDRCEESGRGVGDLG